MTQKNLLLPEDGRARSISFDNPDDPYILFHSEAQELSDDRLKALFLEWRATNELPENEENFEVFLEWLIADRGFHKIMVADTMFHFGGGRIVQCCSCEHIFTENWLTKDRECPFCFSGNWVYGYIDEPEDEEMV